MHDWESVFSRYWIRDVHSRLCVEELDSGIQVLSNQGLMHRQLSERALCSMVPNRDKFVWVGFPFQASSVMGVEWHGDIILPEGGQNYHFTGLGVYWPVYRVGPKLVRV